MMISNELLAEYAKNPANKGMIPDATISRRETNRLCDDAITVHLRIENDRIVGFGFEGDTAIVTTACASIFGESIIDMAVDEILSLDEHYIRENLGIEVTHRRRQSSVFALLATRNALHEWRGDGIVDDFASVLQ
ncbi:MAG TPA: iron-sulfur cluster assembly scaffold protein [bacterium]|nr:iron-sulfur cluster assembly scaffold protein [bacterium]